jgi:hypothetical protein
VLLEGCTFFSPHPSVFDLLMKNKITKLYIVQFSYLPVPYFIYISHTVCINLLADTLNPFPSTRFKEFHLTPPSGPDSSAGIATGYGLDGPGIELARLIELHSQREKDLTTRDYFDFLKRPKWKL